jgi:hypothetical protein
MSRGRVITGLTLGAFVLALLALFGSVVFLSSCGTSATAPPPRPTPEPVGAEPPPPPPPPPPATPTPVKVNGRPVKKNGHPPATANGGPPRIKEAFWNSWLREQGQADEAKAVVRSRSYDVNFDLAAYNYGQRPGAAAGGAPVDPGLLKVLNEAGGDTLPIVVKPFVLGRGLSLQPGRAQTQSLDVRLDRLRDPPAGFTRDEPLPSFADKVQALRVTIGVEADGTGCAAVGLSIWNAAANRPLDYLVREIPVAEADGTGAPADCGSGKPARMTGQLVSLLATQTQQPADAAFHLFEIRVAGADAVSVAVFMRKGENPAALSWRLSRSLSQYVSSPALLLERVNDARNRRDYSQLSEELTGILLPRAAVRVEDQDDVDEARRQLDELLRTAPSVPSVFVRLVDVRGNSVFLPLGLISVGDQVLAKRATVLQPLPREDVPEAGRCIGAWTMVLPQSLGDDVVLPRFLVPVPPSPPERMTDWSAFTSYLKGAPADTSKAEGLLLLAHHGPGGRLAFVPNRPESLLSDDITRRFPRGSVAVLAACSVGQLTGDNRRLPLLTRLNDLGVDAVILSPFPVDGPFGARLAMHFASVVQRARETHETPPPTVRRLFERAIESVRADPAVGPLADEAYEFILAGNTSIPLCP